MRRSFLPACAALFLLPSLANAQQADARLDLSGLTAMLTGLGYEPKKLGETAQAITIQKDRFTFHLAFSISGNAKKVWMVSSFVEIPDLAKIPQDSLTGVLVANGEIGPAHFYLLKSGETHWLKCGLGLDNRNLTPAYLRSEIEWFMDRLIDKATVWEKTKWTPTP